MDGTSFAHSIKYTWVGLFLGIFVFIVGLFPTALLFLHIFLGVRGQTTREYVSFCPLVLCAQQN